MKTEFKRANLKRDLDSLVAFDHRVFRKSDWFHKSEWARYECYWMLVDGVAVGCCAFEHHADFQEDLTEDETPLRGSLFISSSGILPRFQGKGFGGLLKAWQVAYARRHGFTRIVTNHRASNRRMIELNKKFGFRIIRRRRSLYYHDPPEPTVVMELKVRTRRT